MRNKNNTKNAALFAIPAAFLILLARNTTVAAPTDKVPVTVETAQTISYTVVSWYVNEYDKLRPVYSDYVAVSRPDKMYDKTTSLRDNNKPYRVCFANGKNAGTYDFLHKTYRAQVPKFLMDNVSSYIMPPVKPMRVLLNGKPALQFRETIGHSKKTTTLGQWWFDAVTNVPLLYTESVVDSRHHAHLVCKYVYSNWKLNPKLPASLFVFTPPPGSKLAADNNNTH